MGCTLSARSIENLLAVGYNEIDLGDAELDQVGVRADESLFVAAGGELRHNVLDGTMAMVGNGIQNDAISHKSNPPNSFAPPVPAAILCFSA